MLVCDIYNKSSWAKVYNVCEWGRDGVMFMCHVCSCG